MAWGGLHLLLLRTRPVRAVLGKATRGSDKATFTSDSVGLVLFGLTSPKSIDENVQIAYDPSPALSVGWEWKSFLRWFRGTGRTIRALRKQLKKKHGRATLLICYLRTDYPHCESLSSLL